MRAKKPWEAELKGFSIVHSARNLSMLVSSKASEESNRRCRVDLIKGSNVVNSPLRIDTLVFTRQSNSKSANLISIKLSISHSSQCVPLSLAGSLLGEAEECRRHESHTCPELQALERSTQYQSPIVHWLSEAWVELDELRPLSLPLWG